MDEPTVAQAERIWEMIVDGTGDPADEWQARVAVQSNAADQQAGTLTRRGILLERVWAALASQTDQELDDRLTLLAWYIDDWQDALAERKQAARLANARMTVPKGHPAGYDQPGVWRYTDGHLADVAEVFQACPWGNRTVYVSDWFDVPLRTAERWVQKAREAGHDIPRRRESVMP